MADQKSSHMKARRPPAARSGANPILRRNATICFIKHKTAMKVKFDTQTHLLIKFIAPRTRNEDSSVPSGTEETRHHEVECAPDHCSFSACVLGMDAISPSLCSSRTRCICTDSPVPLCNNPSSPCIQKRHKNPFPGPKRTHPPTRHCLRKIDSAAGSLLFR